MIRRDCVAGLLHSIDLQFYYRGAMASTNSTQWWHDVKLVTGVIGLRQAERFNWIRSWLLGWADSVHWIHSHRGTHTQTHTTLLVFLHTVLLLYATDYRRVAWYSSRRGTARLLIVSSYHSIKINLFKLIIHRVSNNSLWNSSESWAEPEGWRGQLPPVPLPLPSSCPRWNLKIVECP